MAHYNMFLRWEKPIPTKGPDVAPTMMTGIRAYPRYGDFLGQQKLL
jgi:hypothetical protein